MTSRTLLRTATLLALVGCRAAGPDPDAAASGEPVELRRAEVRRLDVAEVVHGEGRSLERALRAASAAEQEAVDEPPTESARERRRYKRILAREVGWLDREVLEPHREIAVSDAPSGDDDEIDLTAAREFRARLKQNLEALERANEVAWPALREKIRRDLEEDRPDHVPLSYDDAYEI